MAINAGSLFEVHPGAYAHGSGGLWIPKSGTLLAADLHLGYAWAQRRRGQLGPIAEGGAHERIVQVVRGLGARRVVLLGDIVHAPKPAPDERQWIEGTLGELSRASSVVCVLGNHDRGFGRDFGGLGLPLVQEWRGDGVWAVHGDRLPARDPECLLVAGHFHPVLRVKDAARVPRLTRAFLYGTGFCVLPAFSPFAAGCEMRFDMPAALREWFGSEPVRVVLASGEKVLPLDRTIVPDARKRIRPLKVVGAKPPLG